MRTQCAALSRWSRVPVTVRAIVPCTVATMRPLESIVMPQPLPELSRRPTSPHANVITSSVVRKQTATEKSPAFANAPYSSLVVCRSTATPASARENRYALHDDAFVPTMTQCPGNFTVECASPSLHAAVALASNSEGGEDGRRALPFHNIGQSRFGCAI